MCEKPIRIPKAMKIPNAQAAVDKDRGKSKNSPAWRESQAKIQKEVIEQAQKEGKTFDFGTLLDLCHLKNSEVEQKFQKFEGREVSRGDAVKDDSGSAIHYFQIA